jgi:hypothetical protein
MPRWRKSLTHDDGGKATIQGTDKPTIMKNKILRNHKLINLLVEHKKITLVTVNATHVVCTLSNKFTPDDVQPLCDAVGQWPMPRKVDGHYYIVFERYPNQPAQIKNINGQ